MDKVVKQAIVIFIFFLFQSIIGQNKCYNSSSLSSIDDREIKVSNCDSNVKDEKESLNALDRFLKKRNIKKHSLIAKHQYVSKNKKLNNNPKSSEKVLAKENVEKLASILSSKPNVLVKTYQEVEQIPLFKKCKKDSRSEDCFNNLMKKHFEENLKYPEEALYNNEEGIVNVYFEINTNGEVSNIKVTSNTNHQSLHAEAKRVVGLLPKFKPAIDKGKKVNMSYSFPMEFSI